MIFQTQLSKGILACTALLLSGITPAHSVVPNDVRTPESRDRSSVFVGFVQPGRLYWRPLSLQGLQTVEFRQLSFDDKTGARTLLVKLPPGWKQPLGYHSSNLGMFVVTGSISVEHRPIGRYSYAYYPAGYAHSYSTVKGATVLEFWGGPPNYVQSTTSRLGAKKDEVIDGLRYNDISTTGLDSLPQFRSEPVSSHAPVQVKLLRLDKRTGQMVWVVTEPGGYPMMRGNGKLPLWSSSTTWKEGFLIAGRMTMAECLPQGQVAGQYDPDGYFFRPAGIRHGGPSLYSDSYAIWLFRSGPGHRWVTYNTSCNEPSESTAGGGSQ
ncbi:MAG: cupin domain-containing protein [Terriglobia bacterium]